jgi:hypothetical protein
MMHEDFSDDDVELLKCLPSITQLNLLGSGITDEGLKEIASLPNLAWLDVSHTAVTEFGLLHLGDSESLRYLTISQGQHRFSPPTGSHRTPGVTVLFSRRGTARQ